MPKKYIEFEISESVMLDDAGVLIDLVQKLEDSGFAVLWTISGVDILSKYVEKFRCVYYKN